MRYSPASVATKSMTRGELVLATTPPDGLTTDTDVLPPETDGTLATLTRIT